MWLGVVVEGESGRQIVSQELDLLDVGQKGSVNGLLGGFVLSLSLLVGLLLLFGELNYLIITSLFPFLKFYSATFPLATVLAKYLSSTLATFTPSKATTVEVART